MGKEMERLRKSLGGELVPYGAYEPDALGGKPTKIRIQRRKQAEPA